MCGDLQVASAQPLDFLDTRQKSSFSCRKRVEAENGLFASSLRQSARLLVRRPAGRLRATS
ncbi:hypothetical protein TRIP_B210001 [uncultured Desulfatiglans sp.]|nr:hypothetical protein TRIP_B210001 [uncultured Desulfatiglans sp.]